MRRCKAVITAAHGRRSVLQLPVQTIVTWATDQSMDNDADTFSIDVGESLATRTFLDRDTEVRVAMFLDDLRGIPRPVFNGIADDVVQTDDHVISIQGRDTPSSLGDSDALPGWFNHKYPQKFIAQRAIAVGLSNVQIAKMSLIDRIGTDGTETEWAFWYRMARMKGMYAWSDNTGALVIDKLGYSIVPSYFIGTAPRGDTKNNWRQIEVPLTYTSAKQQRIRKSLVYGEDAKAALAGLGKKAKKTGIGIVAQGIDTTIPAWRKQMLSISTSVSAKNQVELQKEANQNVFESIVGAQEISVTIRDTGDVILENKMARVNLPEYGIGNALYFIVGVARAAGPNGMTQTLRLREKSFALSERIPDAPTIQAQTTASAQNAASLSTAIGSLGVPWSDSFVRAANEFGVKAGWDFAVFLGVLLSICQRETGFTNERQTSDKSGTINHKSWYAKPTTDQNIGVTAQLPGQPPVVAGSTLPKDVTDWQSAFANNADNMLNPFAPNEAGVGPMQLTSPGIKATADGYGWNGTARIGEYDGGRWNPDSNIRAAAALLVEKLKVAPPADPTNSDSIWIGVERYNGAGQAAIDYAAAVKQIYTSTYGPKGSESTAAATATVQPLLPNSAGTLKVLPDGTSVTLPSNTPDAARKAINFLERQLGMPYQWGGNGPNYDCSGLVTAGLNSAAEYLRAMLGGPGGGERPGRETTYTLYAVGRFPSVDKDQLLPGDLVFFEGDPPGHVAMYLSDNLIIEDPGRGGVVQIVGLSDEWHLAHYTGARRVVIWPNQRT